MKQERVRINQICQIAVMVIAELFFAYLILQHFSVIKDSPYKTVVIFALSLGLNLILLCKIWNIKLQKTADHIKPAYVLSILVVLCCIVKGYFIIKYRIEPAADYKTFFDTAKQLRDSWSISNDYVSMFPHIMGYSTFLSIIFKIFGTSTMIPPIINVLLSVISMVFIYKICGRLISNLGAIVSSLLFIFLPSQTIYNIYALSEPLYTTLLLALVWLCIICKEKIKNGEILKKYNIALPVSMGLVIVAINYSRPFGIIIMTALFIWLILILRKDEGEMKHRIIVMLLLIIVFIAGTKVTDIINNSRLGNKVSAVPGYTICVGLNEASNGFWNIEDSTALYKMFDQYDKDVAKTHNAMLKRAEVKIANGINYAELLKWKIYFMWGNDKGGVDYGTGIWKDEYRLGQICNIYYYMLMAVSIWGIIKLIRKKDSSIFVLLILFNLGLLAAHMLAEAAARYHYAAMITFIILAAYGLVGVREKKLTEERL